MSDTAIDGVEFFRPKVNPDRRGSLDVVYHTSWQDVPPVNQWNLVRSNAGVLRGLHAHSRYQEIYVAVLGRMFVALVDARRDSATFRRTVTAWIDQGDAYSSILVPAGVLHGVYFETDGILGYGLSAAWTGDNEYNCAWNDPELTIDWPAAVPILSDRDATGSSFHVVVEGLHADRLIGL